jgi:hypothetical protein
MFFRSDILLSKSKITHKRTSVGVTPVPNSISSDPKNHDDFQTPLASSRFILKTSTQEVYFAGESEKSPRILGQDVKQKKQVHSKIL